MNRKSIGAALLAAGVALGIIGMVLWARESSRVEDARSVNEFGDALGVDDLDDVAADRAPALGAWGVGALLWMSGVVVLATVPPSRSSP